MLRIIKLEVGGIRLIKSRRRRWTIHIACMGGKQNAYGVLVGKPKGKRPLGRPSYRWEDTIKIIYCGMAPKSRIIEHPLLVNGYASRNGFIGSSSFPMQRESSYQSYTFLYTTINAFNRQRTYNMQPLNEGFSIRSDCAIHQRVWEQRQSVIKELSKEVESVRIEDSSCEQLPEKTK
jgi:hypothetical protein